MRCSSGVNESLSSFVIVRHHISQEGATNQMWVDVCDVCDMRMRMRLTRLECMTLYRSNVFYAAMLVVGCTNLRTVVVVVVVVVVVGVLA